LFSIGVQHYIIASHCLRSAVVM